ncbi:cell surface protein [methanogenic archaeon mixed culture ISO4-G1]|nr:cell surface protein [methanogenic archaeon mixed culture ISO4-G1]
MIKDSNGGMPFSLIAVTILLMASIAGAVMAEHSRAIDDIEESEDATRKVEISADGIESYIERELGIIILDISKDGTLGSLDNRSAEFRKRAEAWIDERFPMRNGDLRAELVGRTFDLSVESMGVQDGSVISGCLPTYLRGTGVVTVNVSSPFGSSLRSFDISTDGSCALPLAVEKGSLFERMAGTGGISIPEMMKYELESLAQYRVLNGYGSRSAHGSMGTHSIITSDDVIASYNDALDLISAVCFRDINPDCGPTSVWNLMDDKAVLDTSAFCGQVLVSIIDDLVLKWYDYLRYNPLGRDPSGMFNGLTVIGQCLIGFFTETDPFDASGYVIEFVDNDSLLYPGSGTSSIDVGRYTIVVENPTLYLPNQEWIRQFGLHYTCGSDHLMDCMSSILNGAAEKALSDHLMDVTIHREQGSFVDCMIDGYRNSLDYLEPIFEFSIRNETSDVTISDPFLAALADCIYSHAEDMVLEDELRARFIDSLSTVLPDFETDSEEISRSIDSAVHAYRAKVYMDLKSFSTLGDKGGGGPDPMTHYLMCALASGLDGFNTRKIVMDRGNVMLDEVLSNLENAAGLNLPFPEEGFFLLDDGHGNTISESLDVTYENDPIAGSPVVLTDKCVHMTGFLENSTAGYSTTFQIRLVDLIDYTVRSINPVYEAFGSPFTSTYTGSISNEIVLEISVSSAWALIGVEYSASNKLLEDTFEVLYPFLEPILEPLKDLLDAIKSAAELLNGYLMEIVGYAADAVSRLYDILMGPATIISQWMQYHMEELFGSEILDLYYSLDLAKQQIGFQYMGYDFNIRFDLASLSGSTKTLFVASLSGPLSDLWFEVSLTAKVRGEMNPHNVILTGKGTVESDDWKVGISMDPMMRSSKHLLSLTAKIDDVEISAVLPDLDDYHELGLTLSNIPGIGDALDNIPIPFLGVNIGLDAGISMKYSAPVATGLLINEYESNPPGNDSGKEWVELLNNTPSSIDLDGYCLYASSDRSKKKIALSGTISPGEFLVIDLPFTLANTSSKMTKNGDGLILRDPDGVMVDRTGTHKDNGDDSGTWQRSYDGSTEWEFRESSQGQSNGSFLAGTLIAIDEAKELVMKSVTSAFSEVGPITDLESLQDVVKTAVKNAVDRIIKKVAGCFVEASVFVKVDVRDPTSTMSTGIRVALRCDNGLVEDVMKYIAGKIEAVAMSMNNPYKIDGVAMFTDNIDLEVTVSTGIQYPHILAREVEELPNVILGATFRANISALSRIISFDVGRPEVECGIRIIDCPLEVIPSKLSPKKGMDHDLWLLRAVIEWT